MANSNRLIVALDFSDFDQVKRLVENLGDGVSYYKVGMELYYSVGNTVIDYLRHLNKEIFLDLKLHDIPNTVAHGLTSLTRLGVSMLNVHASGGPTMMKAAAEAVKNEAEILKISRPQLIAVTVLTSISQSDWDSMGHRVDIADQVVRFASLAQAAGIDGVVASPQEAALIRKACGDQFLIVTPGVRPAGAALNDQSRVATPAGALAAGASHLVVGRPITAAQNPYESAKQILHEMEGH
ncbi:orotidine 5'-phosphate decarboxylase [Sporomusaceae bacterium FL31]|nr:orotidine 5'-phosphate decarboxylase [Sporomusaceae bacterium FL31]GCE32381.1 orotidine 5'-phosphate decarboxylase [Sporomusaceae bacterium]